jgi:murein DD-endopeptidase MepM/ murein hydrolase activator NlpD
VTRGLTLADTADERHPGLDIAVPTGTLVRASGGGTVLQTGDHEEYGRFVLLEHPDNHQTMYGHLSRILAVQGASVRAGEVIGRSGNTGRSSAPHLHFEIRVNGRAVDPGTMVREDR